jgi:hypothetical protein
MKSGDVQEFKNQSLDLGLVSRFSMLSGRALRGSTAEGAMR